MPLVLIAFPIVVVGFFLFALAYSHTAAVGSSSGQQGGGFFQLWLQAVQIIPKTLLGLGAKASRWVISHWAEASIRPLAILFDHHTTAQNRQSKQIEGLANDTAGAFERMRHVVIPHAVSTGVAPVRQAARTANRHAETALSRTHTLSTTVTREHAAQVKLNVHYSHAIDVAIPGQLGRIRTKDTVQDKALDDLKGAVRGVEDGAINTFKWIRSHPYSAATGVFTGAVAWALTRLGYGFLRCRSWQNLGRQMKCSDANVLRDLLLGATAIAASLSLVELAKAEQEVIGDLSTVVKDFWQA